MECTSWSPPSPGAAGRSPTPQLSSSRLRLINLLSIPYMFLEGFLFGFPESISDGWVALWGSDQETPKMPAPTPEAPSGLPSNSLHAAPGGLLLKRGSGRHAN